MLNYVHARRCSRNSTLTLGTHFNTLPPGWALSYTTATTWTLVSTSPLTTRGAGARSRPCAAGEARGPSGR